MDEEIHRDCRAAHRGIASDAVRGAAAICGPAIRCRMKKTASRQDGIERLNGSLYRQNATVRGGRGRAALHEMP